jgi:hypothetical protein
LLLPPVSPPRAFAGVRPRYGYGAAVAARSAGQAETQARAAGLLARAVQIQANILSYIDGFAVIGVSTIGCLLLIALLRSAPRPE